MFLFTYNTPKASILNIFSQDSNTKQLRQLERRGAVLNNTLETAHAQIEKQDIAINDGNTAAEEGKAELKASEEELPTLNDKLTR
jgi:hypothetical protein